MKYYTVEYGLYTSLPLLKPAPAQQTPTDKPLQRTLMATFLGSFNNDSEATYAAAEKFSAKPLRVSCLANKERRWLVLNEHEHQSLLTEVA